MAGGMGRRDRPASLSERIVGMERRARPSVPGHCWVADEAGKRHPGLILEWRRQEADWFGLVSYAFGDDAGGFSLVQEWVAGEALRPLT
jgi:hypothetical protein